MRAIAIAPRPSGDGPPLDFYFIGDLMQARGWFFDRGQAPPSLHLTISPAHEAIADEFLADLRACAEQARASKEQPQGKAALYGMLGTLPDRAFVRDALLELMDNFDAPNGAPGTP
jgi:sphinganine-1-phosphate aldolase